MSEGIELKDKTFEIDFDRMFNDYIAANDKKWAHDRSTTLGASEVFDCIRKACYDKRGKEFGFEPDDDYEEDWGALTRGNLIENHHVVPAVRGHMPTGVEMLYTGDDQETLVLDRNSATPDGLITGLPVGCSVRIKGGDQDIFIENIISDCIVFEIKSIDPRAVLLEERTKHHNQTQVQLGLFHEKTEWKPYYSIVLYIDASFLSKMTPFVIKYDEAVFEEAKFRASEVWAVDSPLDLIPEGRFTGTCQYCKWKKLCGTQTNGAIPTYEEDEQSTPETVAQMDVIVQRAIQKRLEKEAAEKAEEIAKQEVKDFLSKRNTRKMKGPTWSVSWYGQDGKVTVDTKAMENDGIDLEPYKKHGADFDVLRITPKAASTKETKPKRQREKKS